MVFFKIRKNWTHAGSTPLLRALLLHGAAYYLVLSLTFGLAIIASMSNEVRGHHLLAFNRPLPAGYSFTIPWWTPSMWQCLAVLQYPDRVNSVAVCVGVVACNHLMLSLREEVQNRPTLMGPLSSSYGRSTTGLVFAAKASNATSSDADQLQTISLPGSTDRKGKQPNLGQKLGTWHEMQPYRG
jgi:hypothetical protein